MITITDPISGLERPADVKERLAIARRRVATKYLYREWFPWMDGPKDAVWTPREDLTKDSEPVIRTLLTRALLTGKTTANQMKRVVVKVVHWDRPYLLEVLDLTQLAHRLATPLHFLEEIGLVAASFETVEGRRKLVFGGTYRFDTQEWALVGGAPGTSPEEQAQLLRRWYRREWLQARLPAKLGKVQATQLGKDPAFSEPWLHERHPDLKGGRIFVYPWPRAKRAMDLHLRGFCTKEVLNRISEADWLQSWAEANLVWDHHRSVFLDRFGDPVSNTYRLPSLHPGRRSWYSTGTETIGWPQAVVGIQTGRIPRRAEAMDESHALGRIHYK